LSTYSVVSDLSGCKKLEARLMLTDEPMVIQMIYVSPDGWIADHMWGLSEDASAPDAIRAAE
jgi:hypothetical protein